MRRRSQEIALPPLMDTQSAPLRLRRRLPVKRVAKRTGVLTYKAVVYALWLLAGFAIIHKAFPELCCSGPDTHLGAGLRRGEVDSQASTPRVVAESKAADLGAGASPSKGPP